MQAGMVLTGGISAFVTIPVALVPGRENCLFTGSASGGKAAAIEYAPLETARFNGIDLQVRLTRILEPVPDSRIERIDKLLP